MFKALAEIEQVEFEDVGTIYVLPLLAPKDFDSKVKSSIVLAYLFKDPKIKGHPIFHQKTVHIVDSIKELPKNLNNKQAKVLLIDDFIGTGGTSVEALQYLVETAQILKQKLLILCLVAQQEGLELIKSINISVYSAIIRGKGISDTYDLSTQAKYYKIMESMENLLQVKKDFRFGYKGSEALVKLIRTPNNTFPVYWYEPVMKNGNKYKAPFPRD